MEFALLLAAVVGIPSLVLYAFLKDKQRRVLYRAFVESQGWHFIEGPDGKRPVELQDLAIESLESRARVEQEFVRLVRGESDGQKFLAFTAQRKRKGRSASDYEPRAYLVLDEVLPVALTSFSVFRGSKLTDALLSLDDSAAHLDGHRSFFRKLPLPSGLESYRASGVGAADRWLMDHGHALLGASQPELDALLVYGVSERSVFVYGPSIESPEQLSASLAAARDFAARILRATAGAEASMDLPA